jgi:flagellar basal body-associated protein FliL
MIEKIKEKIREKIHIIFIVVMVVYLSALATMTVYTYLDERTYWEKQEKQKMSEQTKNRKGGN